ncbi:Serine--tRNA ligase [Gossypium arboreum]|uniref:Serine--tRNA ligase n=1 Tax=Gossypium arboreum TaxID=29729 RepID=A0A0B0MKL5_GOSAR|nr:Serine--tRNA ligase [Gossypium arboreum]
MILVQKRDTGTGILTSASDKSSGIKSNSTPSTPQAGSSNFHAESRLSQSIVTGSSPPMDLLSDARHDREAPEDNFLGQETPLIDLLREQQKILSGEVALHSSALKHLSEEAMRNPQNEQQIQVEMKKLSDEIRGKNEQIASLEKQIAESILVSPNKMEKSEISQSVAELVSQLNEKSFELEGNLRTQVNQVI